MTMRTLSTVISVGILLTLTACATPAPGSGDRSRNPAGDSAGGSVDRLGLTMPAPPRSEVSAQGTVMDVRGDVELCLGAIMESYPPQCSGIPMSGWSWDGVEGWEESGTGESGTIRWGAYAVQGTYDGTAFTSRQPPIPLALYDPIAFADPTGGATGAADEATVAELQDLLPERLGADGSFYLGSYPERGYLWVDVIWDDGTLQQAADAEFGDDVVVIRSALREVG